ncbi:MAG: Inovirus Gp2 [Verrucomicrobiota bacterium]|jgi:hypothetical protein
MSYHHASKAYLEDPSSTNEITIDIAYKSEDILQTAIDYRPRNLFVRLDFHFPNDGQAYNEPDVFSEFMRVYLQNRERKYGKVFHLWVRERNKSRTSPHNRVQHGHYHVYFLFDGRINQNIHGHFAKAQELWGAYLSLEAKRLFLQKFPVFPWEEQPDCLVNPEGLVHYGHEWAWPKAAWPYRFPRPQQCHGVMLRTDHPVEFEAYLYYCRIQAMYLAKRCTKEAYGGYGRTWGSTHRIPSYPQPWTPFPS